MNSRRLISIQTINIVLFFCSFALWYTTVEWRNETVLMKQRLTFCESQLSLDVAQRCPTCFCDQGEDADEAIIDSMAAAAAVASGGAEHDSATAKYLRAEVHRLSQLLAEKTRLVRDAHTRADLCERSSLGKAGPPSKAASQQAAPIAWVERLNEGGLCPANVSFNFFFFFLYFGVHTKSLLNSENYVDHLLIINLVV